jgi:predicted pyridoxine 5'-phosphate oxidase superfamily flavin-nucleotide-binding protein
MKAEVNDYLKKFLAEIDTAFLATASADGQPYVQHRGGPKGFIKPVDAHTVAFLDYSGNRQYITQGNLAENDKVCMILIDYARRRRVKIWGTAKMTDLPDDERLVEIAITRWDVNCPRHINPENAT